MIFNKDPNVVGKVKLDKGRLSLAFPKTRIQQMDIQEQLDTFKESGTIEIMNPKYMFSMKKEADSYNISLTQAVTKTVTISQIDASKIEDMLREIMTHCDGNSLGESHSSTNLLSARSID